MLYFSAGSATTELSDAEMREALIGVLEQLGPRERVIAVPPDFTRFHSRAGQLTLVGLRTLRRATRRRHARAGHPC